MEWKLCNSNRNESGHNYDANIGSMYRWLIHFWKIKDVFMMNDVLNVQVILTFFCFILTLKDDEYLHLSKNKILFDSISRKIDSFKRWRESSFINIINYKQILYMQYLKSFALRIIILKQCTCKVLSKYSHAFKEAIASKDLHLPKSPETLLQ